jgi:hypothetical protein
VTIDDQYRIACRERIARYTVGVAVQNNQGVGTGTLVKMGEEQFVLTAAHVIEGSRPYEIRFWTRPSAPIQQKAAADVEISEIGEFSPGVHLPIAEIWTDPSTDIAAIKLDPSFVTPEAAENYDLLGSHEFLTWDDGKLDGVSLMLFGFPVGNSKQILVNEQRPFRFLGCATHTSEYSMQLNSTAWSGLSSEHSRSKDFVFRFHGYEGDFGPQGFSGGAVWVLGDASERTIWRPDPILIGVVHHYAPKSGLLIAAKLPAFVEAQIIPAKAPKA